MMRVCLSSKSSPSRGWKTQRPSRPQCSEGLCERQAQGAPCWQNGAAAVLASQGEVQVSGWPLPRGLASAMCTLGRLAAGPTFAGRAALLFTTLVVTGPTVSSLPGGQR